MTAKAELWNLLHDGMLVDADGSCPGVLSWHVEIPYLCELLDPDSTSLWVHLDGCREASYASYDDPATPLTPWELVGTDVQVLSAVEDGERVVVSCCSGTLTLVHDDARLEREDGRSLELQELRDACRAYWDAWEREHRRNE